MNLREPHLALLTRGRAGCSRPAKFNTQASSNGHSLPHRLITPREKTKEQRIVVDVPDFLRDLICLRNFQSGANLAAALRDRAICPLSVSTAITLQQNTMRCPGGWSLYYSAQSFSEHNHDVQGKASARSPLVGPAAPASDRS